MDRRAHGFELVPAIASMMLAFSGCGTFVPPEESPRGQDLLLLAREAVEALRQRDYQLLYQLCSTEYRQGRGYEEFLARNRAAEAPYRLDRCRLDQDASRVREDSAVLCFRTAFLFPAGFPVRRLPRRLMVTFVREARGWRLYEVLTAPEPVGASPPPPAPGSSPPPPRSRS